MSNENKDKQETKGGDARPVRTKTSQPEFQIRNFSMEERAIILPGTLKKGKKGD